MELPIKFYLILLFTFNLAYANSKSDCQSLFNKFIKSESLEKNEINLVNLAPKETIIKIDEELGSRVYNITRDQFLESLVESVYEMSFEKTLQKLKKESFILKLQSEETTYQEILLEMKTKRKFAAVLRSVFIVFSKDHESPKNFELFTKAFGKLNDSIEFKVWSSIPDASKKLENSYDIKKIVLELDKFKNSKPKNVVKNLNAIKFEVLSLLEKDDLSVDEFHETRKLMKHYLTTIQVMKNVDGNNELIPAFNFLNELNDSLGGLRDDILKDIINSENHNTGRLTKIKKADREVIPDSLKSNIRTFLNGLVFEE